jgi:hypothetical protein
MKKIIFIFIIINLVSCKDTEIKIPKKNDYFDVDNNGDAKKKQNIMDEIQEIGYLYQPEIMKQEKIEKNNGKNDYKYTLINSDLLDKDSENLKKHSLKIVSNYYNFLTKINKPFIYDKIIVEIIHRNGKVDIFKYSEEEMQR